MTIRQPQVILQVGFALCKAKPSFAHRRFRKIDARGAYKEDDPTAPGGRRFDLRHPNTGEIIPLRRNRGWSFDQIEFDRLVQEGRISFIGEKSIMVRRYLHETDKMTPQSVFYQPTRSASERLGQLIGEGVFEFPKDETILEKFIEMATDSKDTDCIVMDFFAGSATTAHSVISQNMNDGGNRRFIMIQLPASNPENSQAYQVGFKTIADIAKARIRRAGTKLRDDAGLNAQSLDIGFRVLRIENSNMKDTYYTPDEQSQARLLDQVRNVKEDRTSEDLLFQILLDWGVDLSYPIMREEIHGNEVFFVDENALAACFDVGLDLEFVKELAKRKPQRAVFHDDGFASDDVKINVEQIFSLLSPETEIKTI